MESSVWTAARAAPWHGISDGHRHGAMMDWTLDQTLIWIAMRNLDEVERSRSGDRKDHLTWHMLASHVADHPFDDLPYDKASGVIGPDNVVKAPDGEAWGCSNLKLW